MRALDLATVFSLAAGPLMAGSLLLAPAPARAALGIMEQCHDGCTFADWQDGVDYTVPDDGRGYYWNIRVVSDDPNAIAHLESPNQVYSFNRVRLLDGTFEDDPLSSDVPFTFEEHQRPWGVVYLVGHTPIAFDDCGPSTPLGAICGRGYAVWGNNAQFSVTSNADVTIFTSITPAPEPTTWALGILGLFGVGAMLRRRRDQASARQLAMA